MNENEPDGARVVAPPPFLYVVPLVAGLALHFVFPLRFLPLGWLQLAIGLPLVAVGIVLFQSTARTMMRARTGVVPGKPTTAIVVYGPFRFSRNPMYLSAALAYLGVAISTNALWAIVLLPFALLTVTTGVIKREERYLERKFGEEYLHYKARARRWL